MKQANNNEVDLLLRSLARGREKSQSQSGWGWEDGKASADHLDADELNSYAEGVVPAPARARYMEHLADCEACRGIVIGLTQASGAAGRYEVQEQKSGSNFWRTLTAFFSPAVLRFAVPALVLTAVIGIGSLALWQQPRGTFIAQNEPAGSSSSSDAPVSTDQALRTRTDATPSSVPSATESAAKNQVLREESDLQDQKTRVDKAPLTPTESTVAKAPALKDSPQPGDDAGVATTRPYAPEPKAAADPSPPAALGRAEKSAEFAKEQQEKRDDQSRSRDAFRVQSDGEHGPNRSRSNTAPAASQRNAGVMGGRGPNADKNKKVGEDKVNEVETRTVSGRRFARAGGVWVDTDYESTQAAIKVARGSDQFRALVADEPGIRAIAAQLGGVVIVVWKNRAYRIQ